MDIQEVLKTAHITLERATLRVLVNDPKKYPVEKMNFSSGKPRHVLFISYSTHATKGSISLIVEVEEGYDVVAIAEWIEKNELK